MQKTGWRFLETFKTELLYDLVILPLSIYLKEKQNTNSEICMHMFIAALFKLANTWK